MSRFEFLVTNKFSWKMISTKQRFKQNKVGSWHASTKHELSCNIVKIFNNKTISSGLYKAARNFIYFNKY